MEHYLKKLKTRGFKITPRRRAIIALFTDCRIHLTPEAVWKKLKVKFVRCGLPGIYRNLESLVECGILTRIQQFDGKRHYGLCTAKHAHHHHITCVRCGKVEEIFDCALSNKKKIKGYKVISHFMQVNGLCSKCAK